jgi:hypothetical protein
VEKNKTVGGSMIFHVWQKPASIFFVERIELN